MEAIIEKQKETIYQKTFDLLETTKTNWSVEKKPLITEDGFKTESFGNFRKDDNTWLGTTTKSYTIIQNSKLAETLIEASIDITDEFKGGFLDKGKKVYYQAQLSDEIVDNDTIKRYVTALNSHDGTSSIGFGFTNMVVACQNSFHVAMKDVQKFRHFANSFEKIKIAEQEIKKILIEESMVMNNFKRMADAKITDKAKKKVIANLFDIKETEFEKEESEFSTRKLNQMKKFSEILDAELYSHGKTLWGLFNAVTWKTNHEDVKKENNIQNIMYGSGYNKNIETYKILVDLLPKNI